MPGIRELLRPLVADIGVEPDGWAVRSLTVSIRRAVLAAMAAWQVVMVVAVLGSIGWSPALVVGHVAVAVYALVALRNAVPAWLVPAAQGALGLAACVASGDIDSVLVVAACWQINFASCAAGLLVFRRTVVPAVVGGAALIAIVMAWQLPEWGSDLPVATVVTQVSIIAALRIGLPSLFQLAQRTIREESAAAAAVRQTAIVRRVSQQVAEESRALHDTAVNTLAAVASGGAAVADLDDVRRQCAHDVAVLLELRGERVRRPAPSLATSLFQSRGLPIRRDGLDDAALHHIEAEMDPARVRAVVGCVHEAVTNVVKHAGVDRVDVTARVEGDMLVVAVADAGRGFAHLPPGRGVANSIFARAAAAEVIASVDSDPGHGTRVQIVAPLRGRVRRTPALPDALGATAQVIAGLHRRAGLLWAAGVTIVSVVLTAAGGTSRHVALLPMIAVMGAAWGLAYVAGSPRLGAWSAGALAVATGVVFVLSAAATSFGRADAVHWQALAATGPLVLLLAHRPPIRWAVSAVGGWALLVAAVAVHARASANAAGVVLVAGVVGIGFTFGLWRFQQVVSSLGAHAAAAQRRALQARISADAETEAQATYRRWLDAGLDDAIALLDDIATGVRSPIDPETRRRCGEEEAYLRQLLLISPELVHLGHGMMSTLREARARQLQFRLRLGARDAPDEATARRVVEAVTSALRGAPVGGAVSVSVFPTEGGLQVTISGATASATSSPRQPRPDDLAGLPNRRRRDLVQMHIPVSGPVDGAG